uniref:Uncharacterized protein n=1 Tax=Arundo donax TaxID=35708 RepID=A0A0A9HGN3_ARUDO
MAPTVHAAKTDTGGNRKVSLKHMQVSSWLKRDCFCQIHLLILSLQPFQSLDIFHVSGFMS